MYNGKTNKQISDKQSTTYSLPAVVLPAAVHPLEKGQAIQGLCEPQVKEKPSTDFEQGT